MPSGATAQRKHAHVVDVLADLEHGEQLFADGSQLEELGLFIIMIELLELFDELGVGEEVAGRILRNPPKRDAVVGLVERMQAEDVFDERFALEADKDVVAEQKVVADCFDIPGNAVVLGADPLVPEDSELGTAEELEAFLVERVRPLGQDFPVAEKTVANDLVSAALDLGLGDVRAGAH